MNDLDEVVKKLNEIKERRDISMEVMSRELNLSLQSVQRMLHGRTQYPNTLTEMSLRSWIEKYSKYVTKISPK